MDGPITCHEMVQDFFIFTPSSWTEAVNKTKVTQLSYKLLCTWYYYVLFWPWIQKFRSHNNHSWLCFVNSVFPSWCSEEEWHTSHPLLINNFIRHTEPIVTRTNKKIITHSSHHDGLHSQTLLEWLSKNITHNSSLEHPLKLETTES